MPNNPTPWTCAEVDNCNDWAIYNANGEYFGQVDSKETALVIVGLVKQRDELLSAVRSEVGNIQYTVGLQRGRNISAGTAKILERSVASLYRTIARIEAEKSGVVG